MKAEKASDAYVKFTNVEKERQKKEEAEKQAKEDEKKAKEEEEQKKKDEEEVRRALSLPYPSRRRGARLRPFVVRVEDLFTALTHRARVPAGQEAGRARLGGRRRRLVGQGQAQGAARQGHQVERSMAFLLSLPLSITRDLTNTDCVDGGRWQRAFPRAVPPLYIYPLAHVHSSNVHSRFCLSSSTASRERQYGESSSSTKAEWAVEREASEADQRTRGGARRGSSASLVQPSRLTTTVAWPFQLSLSALSNVRSLSRQRVRAKGTETHCEPLTSRGAEANELFLLQALHEGDVVRLLVAADRGGKGESVSAVGERRATEGRETHTQASEAVRGEADDGRRVRTCAGTRKSNSESRRTELVLGEALREPESDLLLRRLDGVRAVADCERGTRSTASAGPFSPCTKLRARESATHRCGQHRWQSHHGLRAREAERGQSGGARAPKAAASEDALVPGADASGLVAPRMVRPVLTASLPSQTCVRDERGQPGRTSQEDPPVRGEAPPQDRHREVTHHGDDGACAQLRRERQRDVQCRNCSGTRGSPQRGPVAQRRSTGESDAPEAMYLMRPLKKPLDERSS